MGRAASVWRVAAVGGVAAALLCGMALVAPLLDSERQHGPRSLAAAPPPPLLADAAALARRADRAAGGWVTSAGLADWEPRGDPLPGRVFSVDRRVLHSGDAYIRRLLVAAGWAEVPVTAALASRGMVFRGRGPAAEAPRWKFRRAHEESGLPLVNHTPGDRYHVTKAVFLAHVRESARARGCDAYALVPETYSLGDAAECERVVRMAAAASGADLAAERWFLKVVDGSLGRGIEPVSLAGLLAYEFGTGIRRETLAPRAGETAAEACARTIPVLEPRGRLLQAAVPRPLLMDGRKADLRVYMLVASTVPYRVYYHAGYARLAIDAYGSGAGSRESRVTNTAAQSSLPGFDAERHLWPMGRGGRLHAEGVRRYGERRWEEAMGPRLRHAVTDTFRALRGKLARRRGTWTLYGVDVAVNDELGMYVLEANTNPSLFVDPAEAGPCIPLWWGMLAEALDIVQETAASARRARFRAAGVPVVAAAARAFVPIYAGGGDESDAETEEWSEFGGCYGEKPKKT